MERFTNEEDSQCSPVERIHPRLVEIFGLDGKRKSKEEQQWQKKEEDHPHVSRLGLEPRTLTLKARTDQNINGLILRRFPRFFFVNMGLR